MKKLYMAAIGLAVLAVVAIYVVMLHKDLSTAKGKVKDLTNTVFSLEAKMDKIQEVSLEAEKQSVLAEQNKGAAKDDVKIIIKTVDCANQQLPSDAIKRMQQYRGSIHSGSNTQ